MSTAESVREASDDVGTVDDNLSPKDGGDVKSIANPGHQGQLGEGCGTNISTTNQPVVEGTAAPDAPQEPPVVIPAAAPDAAISTAGADTVDPALQRRPSEALGPASESTLAVPVVTSTGPTLNISLMLTTGARHPYKVDEKYLRGRKVVATDASGEFDPRALSGYQLKELIWTDWRPEWDPRPASPSSIRLIILGRMIEDKSCLRDFPFNLLSVNVVHMTVKPADLLEDDETAAKVGKSSIIRGREGEDRDAGCRCVIL